MKTIKYLSPSGISRYRKNPEDFYLHYLADGERVVEPQTQPMAIGSSFDAYCKSFIHERLFGKGSDPKYEFNAIFEAQVSPEWRDWAKLHGMYVFDKYESCGALADLMTELNQAIGRPQFEIEVMGAIHNRREPKTLEKGGVVFLGKPDVFYINKFGAHTIIDWKVNGYLSRNAVSPMSGYVRLRMDKKKTGHHPDCRLLMHNGTLINGSMFLNQMNVDWATQLSIYSWLCGSEVGEDFIAGIDQICCAPNGSEFPELRVAEHRLRIEETFQNEVFVLGQTIWEAAHSNHFFRDLTKEESDLRCKLLGQNLSFNDQNEADIFLNITGSKRRF